MKTFLQLIFLVLTGAIYVLMFFFLWIGLYPHGQFPQVIARWSIMIPFIALAAPFIAFVVFVLGYDPRTLLLKRIRQWIINLMSQIRLLIISDIILVLLVVLLSTFLYILFMRPSLPSLTSLLEGDFDTALRLAESSDLKHKSSRLVWLAAQSDIEAKRTLSTSDNPTELAALREEIPDYDSSFAPLWHRYLAQRTLGNVAYCLKGVESVHIHYTNAANIAQWLDSGILKSTSRSHAKALFLLSQVEGDEVKAKTLMNAAETIFLKDNSIYSQRLLGSIYYLEGDYGRAFRTWRAVLKRDQQAKARGLELPNSIERKKLYNNMALARLKQQQLAAALDLTKEALLESWNTSDESHRTEQVRLYATKILCLLALEKPEEALGVFEERRKISAQIRDEGLTPGSLLLKANIHAALWKRMGIDSPNRKPVAQNILNCLLLAQDPSRDIKLFDDHSVPAYKGLVDECVTLWRWQGISFDRLGCQEAILSLIN